MIRRTQLLIAFAAGISFSLPALRAADAPAGPSTAPAASAPESLEVDVVDVKGLVQVRSDADHPWTAAKVGMTVGQGAEFRTGPRSSVTCQIPPDQVLTLDRLGTVKIAEAIRDGSKLKTDLIMKYGRTHYEIEAAGMEHESTIRSPSSTLAVRGTSVSLYDQPPFTPEAVSYHGTATFRNSKRELRFGDKTLTHVANDKTSAAETALALQTVDPTFSLARTASEARYVTDQSSSDATLFFNHETMIPTIEDGPPPPTDSELIADAADGKLPGKLDIVIRWEGNADLNLNVGELNGTNPTELLNGIQTHLSEFLYPGYGLNHSSSGGTIPYDNLGGPNGGIELAYWNTPPAGLYGISAIHMSGGPATVAFDTFLDGKQLNNLTTFQLDSSGTPTGAVLKSSQFTLGVTAPSSPAAFFGPSSGVASVLEFIPSIPGPLGDDSPTLTTVPPEPFTPGGSSTSSAVAAKTEKSSPRIVAESENPGYVMPRTSMLMTSYRR